MLIIREQVLMIVVIYTSFVTVMSNSTYSSAQQEPSTDDLELQNMAEDVCAYNPCQNGGICSQDGDTFKCSCTGTWIGESCEIDMCDPNPCKNGGTCSATTSGYICSCELPFSGNNCEIDGCSPNPCLNGGKCVVLEGEIVCACDEPYVGRKCEACGCKNGKCVKVDGKDVCRCNPGYGNFTKSQCRACECGPDSDCIWTGPLNNAEKTCLCKTGFHEKNGTCVAIDLCPSAPCQNEGVCVQEGNSFSCFCKPPYFGVVCEKVPCMENPCQNGGTCVQAGYSFKCKCKEPFSGDICQYDICHDNPCFNGGTCERRGHFYKCKCKYGYVGIICEKEGYQSFPEETSTIETNENYNETTNFTTIKPGICTTDSDCLNRGICSSNKCECKPNFGGYWCERNLLCEKLQPTCQIMGADCKLIGHKAICDCPSLKMYDPKSGVCEEICNPWRCLHGRCEIDGRTYKCICDTGYKGNRCGESVQAIAERSNIWLYVMISMVALTSLLLIQQICMFFRYRKLKTNTSYTDVMELKSTELTETTSI